MRNLCHGYGFINYDCDTFLLFKFAIPQALDTIKKSAPKKKGKEKTGSSISADDAKKLEKEVSFEVPSVTKLGSC